MSKIIDPDSADVGRIFAGIRKSWFRLATLQHYRNFSEAAAFADFLATGRVDTSANRFVGLIERHAASGRALRRVVVAVEPLSDYLRYTLAFGAGCAAAGEDVRVLPVAAGDPPPPVSEYGDFWLFDDEQLWSMEHDDEGRLIATTGTTEPAALDDARRRRDSALAQSIPLREYLRRCAGDG